MFRKNSHKWSMTPLVFLALLVSPWATDTQAGCTGGVEPIFSVEDFCDVRCKNMSSIDLSDRPNLPATLWFNQGTVWPAPAQMPSGCDPNEIMTNAMNPGLGIRALHQQGITGEGVNVAIIDQPMYLDHPEFAGKIAAYYDTGCGGYETSMHGPAVASLLVGTNCGTAPGTRVYYAAAPSWTLDAAYYADALDWIITQNEGLPSSEKIRVVSVSAAPSGPGSPFLYNNAMWDEACVRAEAAGILVLDVTRFAGPCWYDANDPENVAKCTPGFPGMEPFFDPEEILVPASPRTSAEESYERDFSYHYTGRGGVSWSMPYCAGVLAMGWQIRPELTDEQMVDYLFQTAYINPAGAKIINPPAFMSSLNSDKPVIGIETTQISFYAVTGEGNPEQQILSISNIGFGTLNWVLDHDCNWLNVEPNSGSSIGFSDVNEVTITVTDISVIPRSCELVISDPCATNNPQTVTVDLYVYTDDDGELHVPGEYTTIQAAIDDCTDGDTVIVAPGTYTGAGNGDLDFNGKAITVRSADPNDSAVVAATIIDCNGSESDPHEGFYFHTYEDANSVLSGLTITGAYGGFGGAIECYDSSPAIVNCVFVDNSVSGAGAGMHNHYSSPILINCIFRNNSSDWVGGALRNHTSSPVLINCLFAGNSASAGGAIQNENSSSNPILINCTFSGNTATGYGGGIINAGPAPAASPVLLNCILWGNSDAGGIDESAQVHSGTPVINYCCIQGWTGALGGAGNFNADPSFADTTSPDPNEWDYHLKSTAGRWDPNLTTWVIDALTSPCVDTGDPNSDWTAELWPHGKRINMGAYGGTPQASMSPSNAGNIADLNHDNVVNYIDLMLFDEQWVRYSLLLPEDFDRNGIVDLADFAIVAHNWMQPGSP